MIFAAGFGKRMAPLTNDRPKPLIEVAGKTLLAHALEPAQLAGLNPILVNAHYLSDQIEDALKDENVNVRVEKPEILDTGGGLKAALSDLSGEAVFTMNSDAVWSGPNPYQTLLAQWNPDLMDALVLCVPADHAVGREDAGDFALSETGQVSRGPGYVYTGAQIIKTAPVADHHAAVFSLNAIWDILMEKDRLHGAVYAGSWCDVGRPSSIPLAEAMLNV